MAFSNGSYDVGGPVANINVTPLVDVMLVLLVIFMVTAPMLQQGVDVNLPKATTAPMQGSSEQVVVSIDKEGTVFIGKNNAVEIDTLGPKMQAIMKTRSEADQKVYIKADTALDYGRVVEVMASLHQAGIFQIGLVSSPYPTQKTDTAKTKK